MIQHQKKNLEPKVALSTYESDYDFFSRIQKFSRCTQHIKKYVELSKVDVILFFLSFIYVTTRIK